MKRASRQVPEPFPFGLFLEERRVPTLPERFVAEVRLDEAAARFVDFAPDRVTLFFAPAFAAERVDERAAVFVARAPDLGAFVAVREDARVAVLAPLLRAVVRAVVFTADFRPPVAFAADFRAVVAFAAGFRAVVFLAVVFLTPVFLAPPRAEVFAAVVLAAFFAPPRAVDFVADLAPRLVAALAPVFFAAAFLPTDVRAPVVLATVFLALALFAPAFFAPVLGERALVVALRRGDALRLRGVFVVSGVVSMSEGMLLSLLSSMVFDLSSVAITASFTGPSRANRHARPRQRQHNRQVPQRGMALK